MICIDARNAKVVLQMQINKNDRKPPFYRSGPYLTSLSSVGFDTMGPAVR
jgi:hypothetical protein